MGNVVDIHSPTIRKDPWVKQINKAQDPEEIGALIKKRIEFPGTTGPWLNFSSKEQATDIIVDLIMASGRLRTKLVHGVAHLLYKVVNGDLVGSNAISIGLFKIIGKADITECSKLHHHWLSKNVSFLESKFPLELEAYNEALIAYANTQAPSEESETFWYNLWKRDVKYWWPTAFYGLFKQNSELACEEFHLFVKRDSSAAVAMMHKLWNQNHLIFNEVIHTALLENEQWAGLALNNLLGILDNDQKATMFAGLKALTKVKSITT